MDNFFLWKIENSLQCGKFWINLENLLKLKKNIRKFQKIKKNKISKTMYKL